jgi:hypothetical protein
LGEFVQPISLRAGVVLAAAVALTGAVYSTPAHATPAHVPGRIDHRIVHTRTQATNHSLNWSGYVKTRTGITSTSAKWRVPRLKTTSNGYSSTWVGIDGATSADRFLIQTGTEADVVGGRAEYRAWWEVITPTNVAPETLFSSLVIHPGDQVGATVAKKSSTTWTMSLHDYTTGRSASHTAKFAGPGKSAEWIQEDTDVNGYISAAPNWGSVAFSGIRLNGASPALSKSQSMDIYDSHGTRETSTGAPKSTKDGFTVKWLAAGTRTYAG